MSKCLVKPMTDEFSGCLKEDPGCRFAVKFGFSYHCEHPDHLELATEAASTLGRLELSRRYRELRELRRKKFHAELGMPVMECVSRIVDIMKEEQAEKKRKAEAEKISD